MQRYYLSGFPNFLWFFTMMAALSSLRAMTGRTRRQTETDVNRDVRYFFQRVGPPPRLSVVRMVEEGSHAQRGNIRSGDHITSAAPQEKEQRIIGFFCPITRHCSPSPLSPPLLGSERDLSWQCSGEAPVYHIRINRQTEGHLRGREGERRVDLIFQSTWNTKGGKINKGPTNLNQW